MRHIYFTLINKKAELAKGMVFLVLLAGYPYLCRLLETVLTQRFGSFNRIYVCRLAFFALLTGLTAWLYSRFLCHIKRNWESLTLLGVTPLKSFFLFIFTNIEVLFLQLYLGTMLFQIQGAGVGSAFAANVLYGLLIFLTGTLAGLKAHTNSLAAAGVVAAAGSAFLLGTGRLNYYVVYRWVMSRGVDSMFGENHRFCMLFLLGLSVFSWFVFWLYQRADVSAIADSQCALRLRRPGDVFHRLSRWRLWEKNYVWMYRSREFFFWKLCASVFFALVCCLAGSFPAVFFTAYGICLVTSFYLLEVYRFEQRNFLIYFMSGYSYGKLLRHEIWGGFWLLGDHIFLLLVLLRLRNTADLLHLLLLAAVIFLLSVFVIGSLFAFYPRKQYFIGVCVTLLKLHLPVLQLWFLYQWIRQGKRNWEYPSYEYRA